ncbi:MAG TPA: PAS domain S-box protein [Gaiellaceae bacterium]|nr:PAS domain S-box protein [Gaiellaceae bacterium]
MEAAGLEELRAERDFAAALVETTQTLVCVFDADGRIVRFNRACEEATGFTATDAIGRDARELVIPPEEREDFGRVIARVWSSRAPDPQEGHWLTREGERRRIAWANRPLLDADGDVLYLVSTGLDVTERERAAAELRRLAREQAALRRVATTVAGEAAPERVFDVVTEEAARLLGKLSCAVLRYNGDGTGTIVGRFVSAVDSGGFPVGRDFPVSGEGLAATVARTGRVARVDDYALVRGETAEEMHRLGYVSAVAAPIVVGARIWGAFVAGSPAEPLPAGAEDRLAEFAELVALAIASAEARTQLRASRARIVQAGDAERRRLERNLHDGAQQRLVTLSLALRLAQARLESDPAAAKTLLAGASDELQQALEELRELARGLHPAVLADRGLGPALEAAAARAPFRVDLAAVPGKRLPPAIEAAVYYVASEALTNAAKHAGAAEVTVRVGVEDGCVRVEIADDGRGGAELDSGTGLRGLGDRVEALGGSLELESPAGHGTRLRAAIPLP